MSAKVLIIDDDTRNIFALKATLKARGYECITTTEARQGLAFIDNVPGIRIVLIDMMMPEMDGYEAIPEIKKRKKDIPVIAVTAQAMLGDREKCLTAGADGYISKPIDVDNLIGILNKYAV